MLETVFFCGCLLAERKHISTAVIYWEIITKQQKKACRFWRPTFVLNMNREIYVCVLKYIFVNIAIGGKCFS